MLTRKVNGKEEILSTEDEAAFIVESDANRPAINANLIDAIKSEMLTRIHVVFPAIDDLGVLDLEYERWKSIAPAARQPTADYQVMIDNYKTAKAAIQTVKTFTTQAEVNAYDVMIDPGWPA